MQDTSINIVSFNLQKKVLSDIGNLLSSAETAETTGSLKCALSKYKKALFKITASFAQDKQHQDTKNLLYNYATKLADKICALEMDALQKESKNIEVDKFQMETKQEVLNQYVNNYWVFTYANQIFTKFMTAKQFKTGEAKDEFFLLMLKEFQMKFQNKYNDVKNYEHKVFDFFNKKLKWKVDSELCTDEVATTMEIQVISQWLKHWNQKIPNNHIESSQLFKFYVKPEEKFIKKNPQDIVDSKKEVAIQSAAELKDVNQEAQEELNLYQVLADCVLDCESSLGYDQIVGLEKTKIQFKRTMEKIMNFQDLITLDIITPHSGVLLFGPSGTGKTMLARAIGKDSVGCTFMKIKGTDLLNKYIGGSEKRLNTLFEIAEKLGPCIIFLDEIEGIMGTKEADSKLVHLSNMLLDLTSDMAKKKFSLLDAQTTHRELTLHSYGDFQERFTFLCQMKQREKIWSGCC